MSRLFDSTRVAHPYVIQEAGVQGGRPVIRGTRFPVSSIVQNHRRGLTMDEILKEFPHLTPAQIFDALSYYYDHQDDLDREIAELRDIRTAMERHPPTLQP
jgi:uncharacterized protein (DUF433 family)